MTQLTKLNDLHVPDGTALPSRQVLDFINNLGGSTKRTIYKMPNYAWCGNAEGYNIDLVAVEEKMSGSLPGPGSMSIWSFVNGMFCGRMGLDGDALSIADYLRGGRYTGPVGVDLHETIGPISEGKTARGQRRLAPPALQSLITIYQRRHVGE